MPRAKTPRTSKRKTETDNKVLQMPDNGNGSPRNGFSAADVEAEIRLRAYELYVQRGCVPGQQEQDWLAAEREVLSRHDSPTHTA